MTSTARPGLSDVRQLALQKMSAVLGEGRARSLLDEICRSENVPLATADDLFRFAAGLSKLGGFEGAVGALLSVRAVMLGAKGS